MIRTSLFALTLAIAGSSAAFATEAPQTDTAAVTQLRVDAEYPSQPGPHTVIYRDWSDLAG